MLSLYFPGRRRATGHFLEALRDWVDGHDDAIKGEDIKEKVDELRFLTEAFDDLPKEWVGCRGSESRYGGYPCGLWTLFHTLTVSQASKKEGTTESDSRAVLVAMSGFVEHFFGCRDCARHFALMADGVGEGGEKKTRKRNGAILADVHSSRDAVLWLWKAHNRVNKVGWDDKAVKNG